MTASSRNLCQYLQDFSLICCQVVVPITIKLTQTNIIPTHWERVYLEKGGVYHSLGNFTLNCCLVWIVFLTYITLILTAFVNLMNHNSFAIRGPRVIICVYNGIQMALMYPIVYVMLYKWLYPPLVHTM